MAIPAGYTGACAWKQHVHDMDVMRDVRKRAALHSKQICRAERRWEATQAGSSEFCDKGINAVSNSGESPLEGTIYQTEHKKRRPPMFLYGNHHGDEGMTLSLAKVHVGDRVILNTEESRHARTVLRLVDGSIVQVCDGCGVVVEGCVEFDAPITDGSRDLPGGRKRRRSKGSSGSPQVHVRIVEEPTIHPMSMIQWHVAVACGSLKGGRADWLVEKCAEIGATRFTPLLTKRSPDMKREAERWERLTVSVMKQSLQAYRMDICDPCQLDTFLESCSNGVSMYVGSEDAPTTFGAALHRDVDGHGQEVILLIGPEGDFTPEELGQIIDHGVQPVTMGARRLRTETAAIAMLSYAIVHTGT